MRNVATHKKRLERLKQINMFPANPEIEAVKAKALKEAKRIIKEQFTQRAGSAQ